MPVSSINTSLVDRDADKYANERLQVLSRKSPPPDIPPRPTYATSSSASGLASALNASASLPPSIITPTDRSYAESNSTPMTLQHDSLTNAPGQTHVARNIGLPPPTSAKFGFRERLQAGVSIGKEWGEKGKGRLQESWKARQEQKQQQQRERGDGSPSYSASIYAGTISSMGSNNTNGGNMQYANGSSGSMAFSSVSGPGGNSPLGSADNPIKLPVTILGIRVPNKKGMAFGRPLAETVESTRIYPDVHLRRNMDEVIGDDAKMWLPAVAFRCLEYMEIWGRKEEGVYRVPGRTNQIAQLRALFDSGTDLELKEIHPGDLDPHAVASLFKSWLRELPDTILSVKCEPVIDKLAIASIGYSASSSNLLSQKAPGAAPGGPTPSGMVDGRAPRVFIEQIRDVFSASLPAEEYHLLRALSYHLARLSSDVAMNKMTLSNLRLILSPTLRLSPVMLQILVEEREILFSLPNDSARLREGNLRLANNQVASSPAMSTASEYSTSSGELNSPNPQGTISAHTAAFLAAPLSRSREVQHPSSGQQSVGHSTDEESQYETITSTMTNSHLTVSDPPSNIAYSTYQRRSPTPTSASSAGSANATTPIADRFAQTAFAHASGTGSLSSSSSPSEPFSPITPLSSPAAASSPVRQLSDKTTYTPVRSAKGSFFSGGHDEALLKKVGAIKDKNGGSVASKKGYVPVAPPGLALGTQGEDQVALDPTGRNASSLLPEINLKPSPSASLSNLHQLSRPTVKTRPSLESIIRSSSSSFRRPKQPSSRGSKGEQDFTQWQETGSTGDRNSSNSNRYNIAPPSLTLDASGFGQSAGRTNTTTGTNVDDPWGLLSVVDRASFYNNSTSPAK